MGGFRFPLDIWYFGRPYTFMKFVEKDGVKYAIYRETTLDVELPLTESTFRYYEFYGHISRGQA